MRTKKSTKIMLGLAASLLALGGAKAQTTTPPTTPMTATNAQLSSNAISEITNGAGTAAPGGNLWGYVFGDYAYAAHGDSAGRGTKMQYKGIDSRVAGNPGQNQNAFEVRRAYLGYNYNINSKFSAYALLAYEGDYDVNNNRTVYLKYIYFKWKNIFKGSDLKIGQQATNSFANAYNTEPLMGYRSSEKTIMDMHGVDGSSDMGLTLEGKVVKFKPADSTKTPSFIGYSVMVGDNSGNTPVPVFTGAGTATNATSDINKKYRANVYFNTLNGALTLGLYTDYINYGATYYTKSSFYQNATQTMKGYLVYNSQWFGIGVEYFMQTNKNGEIETFATKAEGTNDTTDAKQNGISIFAHGTIIQNKLNIFARYDMYTPDADYSNTTGETFTSHMTNVSNAGNGNSYKETFINAGLDWSPTMDKRVHFMPNIWYYGIANGTGSGALKSDNYMIYRITFLAAF
ncbi:MAG TPA: hypothetical protein VK806_01265 [Bacteroidia bacterium]|nr:hypothetical protein [Bacteroidia bacterium]